MSNKNYNLIIYQLIIDNLFNYLNDNIKYDITNDIVNIKYTLTQLFKVPQSDLDLMYALWEEKIKENYLKIIKLYKNNSYDIDAIHNLDELESMKIKYNDILVIWINSFPHIYKCLCDNFDFEFNNKLKKYNNLKYTDYKIITFLSNFQNYINVI